MYKDGSKRREADRNRQRQRRDRIKAEGVTKGVTDRRQSVTNTGCDSQGVTEEEKEALLCAVFGPQEPEDQPKRGKDIKCFADLPPNVQETIHKLSTTDGTIDRFLKANRTAIAVNYQHMSPDRYHPQDAVISSPVCTGKPGDADYNGVCTAEWRAERGR